MADLSTSFAPTIEEELKALPLHVQEKLSKQIATAMHVGLLTLVLKDLKKHERAKFEKVVLEMKESDLYLYAYAHVLNFNQKYEELLREISNSFLTSLQKEKEINE